MDLKKLRAEKKMTQVDVCKVVGVSLTAYRNWELGVSNPLPENLKKLKIALGVESGS